MAMAPGNQAITGGTVLRAPAIQSPNYSPGVAGWIIRQDGSSEFNTGTFRGSIEVGSLTGAHFIVNNSGTGDVIDVYDSSNRLVFSIDSTGVLTSYSPGSSGDPYIRFSNGRQTFNNASGFISPDPPAITMPTNTVNGSELSLYSGEPNGVVQNATSLQLFGGTNAAGAEIRATSRGGVTGDVLQLDSSNNDRNLVHVGSYSGTVNDGFGDVTIAHGASFTPKYGFLQAWDVNSVGQGWQLEWFQNPFNSVNIFFFVRNQSGGIPAVGTVVGVHAVLYG